MNKYSLINPNVSLSRARYDDVNLRLWHATLAPPQQVEDPLGSPHLPAPHSNYLGCLHTKELSQRHVEQ